jgi:hypothetical protein
MVFPGEDVHPARAMNPMRSKTNKGLRKGMVGVVEFFLE